MKPPLGFVIVTYDKPDQTLGLCNRLNVLFCNPPISIHHDFSKCPLDKTKFKPNVFFTEKTIETKWANITVCDSMIEALTTLYEKSDPDWFVSLSSTDYPIQTAEYILSDLRSDKFDLHMDIREIKNLGLPYPWHPLDGSYHHPLWVQVAYLRYMAIPMCSVKFANLIKKPIEKLTVSSKLLIKLFTPFKGPIKCYAGDPWFMGNKKAAMVLLNKTPLWKALRKHFTRRFAPEEAFYHTILGNASGLKISTDNKRYTDWAGSWAHPRTLGRDDFEALLQSTHYFARKFEYDPIMLSELDELVSHKADSAKAV